MKFHKYISVILHPIVIPTVVVMLYFLADDNHFESTQKLAILGNVFVVTYLIPLLILFIFKKLNMINGFQTESLRVHKILVAMMIMVFYFIGNTLINYELFEDLVLLFFSTSFGLFIIYLLFFFNIKPSVHLLSFGIPLGFFLILGSKNQTFFLAIIIVMLFLSGVVASSILHLKMHNNKEVYLGFFIGLLSTFITCLFWSCV